ncbi:AAA family ATPase [Streptomyces hydrogenans]|uniref:AAA family ATPase n=1 Tax=Streptomyces hydrogenans TaxID=1873719 RepID=UPI003685A603
MAERLRATDGRMMDSGHVLTDVTVTDLLGRFTHRVGFPADDEFVIVHGPNGVGKTMLLDLISAIVWPVDIAKIMNVPFRTLRLAFSDDSVLTIDRASTDFDRNRYDLDQEDHRGVTIRLTFVLTGPHRRRVHWSSVLQRHDDRSLTRDSETLLFSALSERAHVPLDRRLEQMLRNLNAHTGSDSLTDKATRDVPPDLREFLAGIAVHSIDTHRLLGLSAPDAGRSLSKAASLTKVEQFAQDLARRLGDALVTNSRTSQELDRTYPQRLLASSAAGNISEQEIRSRYDAQNELRRRLGDISLVDEDSSVIVIPKRMEPWQRAVLWTYLSDTEHKLATFKGILDRVSLLQSIINSRFLFKRLEIDRERGFRLLSDEDQELDLTSLSSGEQHELVLVYDLLFNVPTGALVLIDEPEISLHVSWQKGFIGDLRKIASLVRFRSVVATHSPQIAGRWADRMVVLGPTAE